jgi:hypothetical protein
MLKAYRENGNPLEPFQLWAKYQDVTLHLEWTSGQRSQLKRFIVFVMHPQIFLLPWGPKHAALQDLQLAVAGKLAKIGMIENFYQTRKWSSKRDFQRLQFSATRTQLEEKAILAVRASLYRKVRKANEAGGTGRIMSTSRLREILELEISRSYTIDELAIVEESGDYTHLPDTLQEWLTGQKPVLF